MKQTGIYELAVEWRSERADYLARAEKARARHFEINPNDAPERAATGDWMFWEDKATALGQRIDELERAILGSVPGGTVEIGASAPPRKLDDARRRQLDAMIGRMSDLVTQFYLSAVQIGNHPFIEWTGVMNEYIRLCINALEQDIDFTEANIHSRAVLPVHEFNVDYFAEKVRCIFGNTLAAQPELGQAFLEKVISNKSVALELPGED